MLPVHSRNVDGVGSDPGRGTSRRCLGLSRLFRCCTLLPASTEVHQRSLDFKASLQMSLIMFCGSIVVAAVELCKGEYALRGMAAGLWVSMVSMVDRNVGASLLRGGSRIFGTLIAGCTGISVLLVSEAMHRAVLALHPESSPSVSLYAALSTFVVGSAISGFWMKFLRERGKSKDQFMWSTAMTTYAIFMVSGFSAERVNFEVPGLRLAGVASSVVVCIVILSVLVPIRATSNLKRLMKDCTAGVDMVVKELFDLLQEEPAEGGYMRGWSGTDSNRRFCDDGLYGRMKPLMVRVDQLGSTIADMRRLIDTAAQETREAPFRRVSTCSCLCQPGCRCPQRVRDGPDGFPPPIEAFIEAIRTLDQLLKDVWRIFFLLSSGASRFQFCQRNRDLLGATGEAMREAIRYLRDVAIGRLPATSPEARRALIRLVEATVALETAFRLMPAMPPPLHSPPIGPLTHPAAASPPPQQLRPRVMRRTTVARSSSCASSSSSCGQVAEEAAANALLAVSAVRKWTDGTQESETTGFSHPQGTAQNHQVAVTSAPSPNVPAPPPPASSIPTFAATAPSAAPVAVPATAAASACPPSSVPADKPAGGGPRMILRGLPLNRSVETPSTSKCVSPAGVQRRHVGPASAAGSPRTVDSTPTAAQKGRSGNAIPDLASFPLERTISAGCATVGAASITGGGGVDRDEAVAWLLDLSYTFCQLAYACFRKSDREVADGLYFSVMNAMMGISSASSASGEGGNGVCVGGQAEEQGLGGDDKLYSPIILPPDGNTELAWEWPAGGKQAAVESHSPVRDASEQVSFTLTAEGDGISNAEQILFPLPPPHISTDHVPPETAAGLVSHVHAALVEHGGEPQAAAPLEADRERETGMGGLSIFAPQSPSEEFTASRRHLTPSASSDLFIHHGGGQASVEEGERLSRRSSRALPSLSLPGPHKDSHSQSQSQREASRERDRSSRGQLDILRAASSSSRAQEGPPMPSSYNQRRPTDATVLQHSSSSHHHHHHAHRVKTRLLGPRQRAVAAWLPSATKTVTASSFKDSDEPSSSAAVPLGWSSINTFMPSLHGRAFAGGPRERAIAEAEMEEDRHHRSGRKVPSRLPLQRSSSLTTLARSAPVRTREALSDEQGRSEAAASSPGGAVSVGGVDLQGGGSNNGDTDEQVIMASLLGRIQQAAHKELTKSGGASRPPLTDLSWLSSQAQSEAREDEKRMS
uniref:Uncharacterized protein n=1 Tax=Chromera velia CCMP2878 TaxID=1169474 RepID=A0A0G4I6B0_9ALVE|eukprot:Cvel_11361.t1-p1 / transcript=Cvel_11361.t1 / gene=Cvel_11361 / organism=Chromera_velia_CCMP2878 / gene_product=hypothetical protein / transcript_product=hypothetical protein / location=Cvel_scaffold712:19752-24535(+) / protein_length=1213 / sequence_SO=supercontig / SO=protein_coding / is_pseudo=false